MRGELALRVFKNPLPGGSRVASSHEYEHTHDR